MVFRDGKNLREIGSKEVNFIKNSDVYSCHITTVQDKPIM
jgi:hypothetical protein